MYVLTYFIILLLFLNFFNLHLENPIQSMRTAVHMLSGDATMLQAALVVNATSLFGAFYAVVDFPDYTNSYH